MKELNELWRDRSRLMAELRAHTEDGNQIKHGDATLNSLVDEYENILADIKLHDRQDAANGISGYDEDLIQQPGKKYLIDASGHKHRIYSKGEPLAENSHLIDPVKYINALVWGPKDEVYERAISTTSGQTLKTEFSDQVIDLARKRSAVFAAGARTIKIEGDSQKFTRLTADGAATWTAENGAVSDVSPTFDTMALQSNALLQLVKVSTQADQDSVNIGQALLQQAVGVFAKELDNKALEGSGTDQPEGVFNYTNVNTVSLGDGTFKFSSYGMEPFVQMQYELNSDNTATTAFLMSPRSFRDVSLTADTTNQPLRKPPAIENIPFIVSGSGVISDARTVATATSECSTMYAADWTQLIYASRMDLTTQVLKERYVDNFQVGLLFALRGDFLPTQETSFVKIGGVLDEGSAVT